MELLDRTIWKILRLPVQVQEVSLSRATKLLLTSIVFGEDRDDGDVDFARCKPWFEIKQIALTFFSKLE